MHVNPISIIIDQFIHATCIFSPISTWIDAVDCILFTIWPGLTTKRIQNYCTKKEEMALGHLKMMNKNICLTQPILPCSTIYDCRVFILNEYDIYEELCCSGSNFYNIQSYPPKVTSIFFYLQL